MPGTSAGAGHTATERQMETAQAKAQATSGPEVAASPASPVGAAAVPLAPTSPTHYHPGPCPLSLSQVLAWPTILSGFSVIRSPLCIWWDLPASGMSLPLHFSSARNIYHLQCCILYYHLCLPSLVEYQLHTGGSRACFFPDVSEAPGTWQIVDINRWL